MVAENNIPGKGGISGGDKLLSLADIMYVIDGISASLLEERRYYPHGILYFKHLGKGIDFCGKMATQGRIASADNLKSLTCFSRGLQDIRSGLKSQLNRFCRGEA